MSALVRRSAALALSVALSSASGWAQDHAARAAANGSTWSALALAADRHGVQPAAVYDGELVENAHGGVRRGTSYLGVARAQLLLDLERGVAWPGASLFGSALFSHGQNPSELVGDAQGVSNLAAPAGAQVYELWLQQTLAEGALSVLAGRYDLSSEFYRLTSAGLFLNSSFGTGPELAQSGRQGPSIFPDTSLGLRVAFKAARGVVLRLAALDGVPLSRPRTAPRVFSAADGWLLVAEQAFLSRPAPVEPARSHRLRIGRNSGLPPYRHKLALGAWSYTASFDDLAQPGRAGRHIGSSGVYALGDAQIHQGGGLGQVNAFVQLGLGDARVGRFGAYLGAGVVVSGLWSALENDELGLAIAHAQSGSHYLTAARRLGANVSGAETTLELTYLVQLGPHLALQPDLAYVIHPSAAATAPNALVAALRFELHS